MRRKEDLFEAILMKPDEEWISHTYSREGSLFMPCCPHPSFTSRIRRDGNWIGSRANVLPYQILGVVISRARLGGNKLHHFELLLCDDSELEEVPHQLDIGTAPRQWNPNLEVLFSDMIQHGLPCHISLGIRD